MEFDNLDSFTRSHGLMTRKQGLAYAKLLVEARTPPDLAAGQKNLAGYDGTTIGFDFAVAEECGRYRECARTSQDYGDQVLVIEYRAQDFRRTCAQSATSSRSCCRDRDLSPTGVRRWC